MKTKYAASLLVAGLILAAGVNSASAHLYTQGPVGAHDPASVNCTDHIQVTYNARPAPGYSSQYVAASTYNYWWNGSWQGRGWTAWNTALVSQPPSEIIGWGYFNFDQPSGYHYMFTRYAWYNHNTGQWDGVDGVWTTSYYGNRTDFCYQL